MAKQTVSKTKKTVAKKKTTSTNKTSPNAKKSTTAKKTTASKKTTSANAVQKGLITHYDEAITPEAPSGPHEKSISLLPSNWIRDTMEGLTSYMSDFVDLAESNLTPAQRRRKVGAGVRNYGFIDKASDLAEANPQYAKLFEITDLKNCIRNIEDCRDLLALLQGFARAVSNAMLIYSDDAYSMALLFYRNVQQMARRGDPQATALFAMLEIFFRRRRNMQHDESVHQVERDVNALLHGRKDGKVVIENHLPLSTGGVKKIVDDVHKTHAVLKETAEAEVKN